MPALAGRCLCGDVTYRLTADPITTRVCWCRDCQRLAANGTVNVVMPTTAIEWSGDVREITVTADSGHQISRRFCPRCGCHLFAHSSARPHLTVVRAGTLTDPSVVKPVLNMWAASAPAWACLDPGLERVEGQPGAAQATR